MDGIFHVCRAFEDPDVIHVEDRIDPVEDMEIIHGELRAKDLARVTTEYEVCARQDMRRGQARPWHRLGRRLRNRVCAQGPAHPTPCAQSPDPGWIQFRRNTSRKWPKPESSLVSVQTEFMCAHYEFRPV